MTGPSNILGSGFIRARYRVRTIHHGSGLLIGAIVITLTMLAMVAISRTTQSSSMANRLKTEMAGQVCEGLAGSAVQELEAQVREALGEPTHPIAKMVAEPVLGESSGSLDLTNYVKLEETPILLTESPYQGYILTEFSVNVVVQKCIGGLPYERLGVFVFKAQAQAPYEMNSARRTVEEARAFKVALPTMPRPFDRYGLFIADMRGVTDLDEVNPRRDRLIDLMADYHNKLKDAAQVLQGDPKERILDLLDRIPTPEACKKSIKDFPTFNAANPGMLYGLLQSPAELNLVYLDLAGRLKNSMDKSRAALAALPQPDSPEFVNKAGELGKMIDKAIWAIWAYREVFAILPSNAPKGYQDVNALIAKLTPEYFAVRAQYKIDKDDPKKRSISEQFDELVGKGSLNAIVYVSGKGETLNLTGRYPGQLLVVVKDADVVLRDAKAGEDRYHRFTVATWGNKITVGGKCDAQVIVGKGTTLYMEEGTVLRGGLAMMEVSSNSVLRGTLIRDGRYSAGVANPKGQENAPSFRFIYPLSPRMYYRRVTRS